MIIMKNNDYFIFEGICFPSRERALHGENQKKSLPRRQTIYHEAPLTAALSGFAN